MDNNAHFHPMCGLHGVNVVVSEYNENGECKCLKCLSSIMWCQNCTQYKKLLQEADDKNQLRLERCIACMNQR